MADDIWRELAEIAPVALLSGGEPTGVDAFAYGWGARNLPTALNVQMKADWARWGNSAGMRRNRAMAQRAARARATGWSVEVHAWWNGSSVGTANMMEVSSRLGLTVELHRSREWEQ